MFAQLAKWKEEKWSRYIVGLLSLALICLSVPLSHTHEHAHFPTLPVASAHHHHSEEHSEEAPHDHHEHHHWHAELDGHHWVTPSARLDVNRPLQSAPIDYLAASLPTVVSNVIPQITRTFGRDGPDVAPPTRSLRTCLPTRAPPVFSL